MKGRSIVILCLLISFPLYGQSKLSASLDAVGIMKEGSIRIGFRYSFHDKWSADGNVSLPLLKKRIWLEEEDEHYSDSDRSGNFINGGTRDRTFPEYAFGVSYWIREHCEGGYISILCSCKGDDNLGAEFLSCIGYTMKIWKGIGIDIGYKFDLLNMAGSNVDKKNGIYLNIFYRF